MAYLHNITPRYKHCSFIPVTISLLQKKPAYLDEADAEAAYIETSNTAVTKKSDAGVTGWLSSVSGAG